MRVTMSRWSCLALLLAGCRAGLEIQISLDGEVVGKAFDAADVGDRAALLARARTILAELGGVVAGGLSSASAAIACSGSHPSKPCARSAGSNHPRAVRSAGERARKREASFAGKELARGYTRRRGGVIILLDGEDAGSTQEIQAAHWGDAGRRSRRRGREDGRAERGGGGQFQQLAIGVQRENDAFDGFSGFDTSTGCASKTNSVLGTGCATFCFALNIPEQAAIAIARMQQSTTPTTAITMMMMVASPRAFEEPPLSATISLAVGGDDIDGAGVVGRGVGGFVGAGIGAVVGAGVVGAGIGAVVSAGVVGAGIGAVVGAGIGAVVGAGVVGAGVVGAGVGAGEGENVSVVTPVTVASAKPRRRAQASRRRLASATTAVVNEPSLTTRVSSVLTYKNRLA